MRMLSDTCVTTADRDCGVFVIATCNYSAPRRALDVKPEILYIAIESLVKLEATVG